MNNLSDGLWEDSRNHSHLALPVGRQYWTIKYEAFDWCVKCTGFGYWENVYQVVSRHSTREDAKNFILEQLTQSKESN
jgi:hypothetical protein